MKKIIALVLALAMMMTMAVAAQAEKETYTVGICQLVQHAALDAATKGFRDALTDKLGDKVIFDEQNASGESALCTAIVTGFVANEYDLIMANATPALLAARAATETIPILGTSVTDFFSALELDATEDGSTGKNISGTSDGVPAQLYADCLMELIPDAKKVAIIYCDSEPNSKLQADQFVACMDVLKIETVVRTFADSNDIQQVVTAAIEGVDAVYIPTDNTAASNMTIISNICTPACIPVICGEEGMCASGGLATVSISYYDIGYVCGEMAYEILVNGADISTMPIGYAANPVKKYNADVVDAIDFTLPEGYEPIEIA